MCQVYCRLLSTWFWKRYLYIMCFWLHNCKAWWKIWIGLCPWVVVTCYCPNCDACIDHIIQISIRTKSQLVFSFIYICHLNETRPNMPGQKQSTVKPVYSGHLREIDKMTTIYRWPLYEGVWLFDEICYISCKFKKKIACYFIPVLKLLLFTFIVDEIITIWYDLNKTYK
jgi:hypothetical protein